MLQTCRRKISQLLDSFPAFCVDVIYMEAPLLYNGLHSHVVDPVPTLTFEDGINVYLHTISNSHLRRR